MLIVAMSCKKTSIDTGHIVLLPRCWRTVFCSQSGRRPVWSALICWAALKKAHFSNGKATHWYKRANLCLAGCHMRELATRKNTYVRLYISSANFLCKPLWCLDAKNKPLKKFAFDIYRSKVSSTRASQRCWNETWAGVPAGLLLR